MENQAPKIGQTEYNSNQMTIFRIDEIKKGLAICIALDDHERRFKLLKTFYFELIGMINSSDDNTLMEKYELVSKKYREFVEARRSGKTKMTTTFLFELDNWEIELRNMEQKYGMGMTKKEEISIKGM